MGKETPLFTTLRFPILFGGFLGFVALAFTFRYKSIFKVMYFT